jgi:O-antigen/teichoic acid export membrane protein
MKEVIRDLAGKGLIYGLGSSLNGVVGFVLIPLYMQYLYAAQYGRYALAEMVLNLMLVLLGLGMNVALLARYPKIQPEDRREYIGGVVAFVLISTIVIEALFCAVAASAGNLLLPALDARIFLLVGAISALETLWMLFATLYRVEGLAWRYISASFLQVGIGLVATVAFIVGLGLKEEGILYGRLLGDGVLFAVVLLPRLIEYRPRLNLESGRELLRIGLSLVPATLAVMWVLMSPRYFIEWFGGTYDVGVFSMSSKIASVVTLVFVQPFALAWLVLVFRIFPRPDARRIYARVLTYYVLVGGTLALTLGIVAPAIAALLGKETFPLSADVIVVMALAYVASGLIHPVTIGPYVREAVHTVVPIYAFSVVMSLVLSWFMTPLWGVQGAAFALLTVYLVQAALLVKLSNALYRVPFEWGRITKAVGALGIAFCLTRYLSSSITHGEAIGWFSAPLFVALFLILLILLRFPDMKELAFVRSVVGRGEVGV